MTTREQITKFLVSMKNWAQQRFPITTEEQYQARAAICGGCEHKTGEGFSARCGKCGCFISPKISVGTEKCPVEKWGPL